MKKKKWIKQGNLFIFPHMVDGLIRKGRSALEEKRYDEAVYYLTNALEHSLEDEVDVKTALLLALYENSQYDDALELCKDMFHQGIGDYYDVLDIYVLILLQLKQYDEIHNTLTALMEEKQLPEDKKEYFHHLLELSKKMTGSLFDVEQPLFKGGENLQEQTIRLMELVQENIQPYKTALYTLLKDRDSHPFLQTLALNVLKEHGVNERVEVKKFHFQQVFVPVFLKDVFEGDFYLEVMKVLEGKLSQQDPILWEQVQEMLKRHFFLLYPFQPDQVTPIEWGNACLSLIRSYYEGEDVSQGDWSIGTRESLLLMKQLDEISSPNI